MACARCRAEVTIASRRWCADCERNYDVWVRRHASDIVWQALSGTVVLMIAGLGLPFLGLGPLVAALGAFAGFGTIAGLSRLTRRVRRKQFLQAPLPRAYLPFRPPALPK